MIDLENYVAAEMTSLYEEIDYTRYYNAELMRIDAMEILQRDNISTISKARSLTIAMEMQISISNFYKDDIYDIRMREWPSTDYSHTKERMKRLEDLVDCIYANWKTLYNAYLNLAYLNLASQNPEVPRLTMSDMWR